MRLKKRATVRIVIILSFVFLVLVSIQPPIYGEGSIKPITSEDTIQDELVESNPDSLLNPKDEAITSAGVWNWIPTDNLFNDPYGTANYPSRLASDDGSVCRITEEYDGTNYRMDLRFRTSTAVYAHNYGNRELRVDFTQVWSLFPEDLKFYVCIADSAGNEQAYTYVGQLSSPGVHSFDLDSHVLFDTSITSARFLFIRIVGAIESGDSTGNGYDFDMLGIAYKDAYPFLESHSCDADENYRLYPMYGIPSSQDYAEFTQTISCRDGFAEIQTIEFYYYDVVGGFSTWTATWDEGSWGMTYQGDANSDWAELLIDYCTTSTTSTTRTVTFAVRIKWDHPTAIDAGGSVRYSTYMIIGLESHYDNYMVESRLGMQVTPSISENRVNPYHSCTYSGDVEYYNSPGHIAPYSNAIDIQVHIPFRITRFQRDVPAMPQSR